MVVSAAELRQGGAPSPEAKRGGRTQFQVFWRRVRIDQHGRKTTPRDHDTSNAIVPALRKFAESSPSRAVARTVAVAASQIASQSGVEELKERPERVIRMTSPAKTPVGNGEYPQR